MKKISDFFLSDQLDWSLFLKRALLFSAFCHILAACLSIGHHHPDEHFMILEHINFKMGLTPESVLTWEYPLKMRPFIQTGFFYLIIKYLVLIGFSNPFFFEIILRIISSLAGLYAIYLFIKWSVPFIISDKLKRLYTFSFCAFALLPYIHARISAEAVGGSLFFIGLFHLLNSFRNKSLMKASLATFIIGISFFVRFQLGFMIAGLYLWLLFIERIKLSHLLLMVIPLFLAFAICILADYWGYGSFTLTPWNYFEANIIHDKAAGWGVHPWWYYFYLSLIKGLPPISLFFIGGTLFYWYKMPKDLMIWVTLPFFILHSVVGHKEMRFLYPMVICLPFFAFYSYEAIATRFGSWKKIRSWAFKITMVLNLLVMAFISFKPANFAVVFFWHINQNYKNLELYSLARDPYQVVAQQVYFYRPENYKLHKVGTFKKLEEAIEKQPLLFFYEKNTLPQEQKGITAKCSMVYQSIPEWIKHFNFTNWMSRSRIWSLYECKK